MARFLILKFPILLKLNFNKGQFKTNIKFWLFQKIANLAVK